jgi:hypothetical protein
MSHDVFISYSSQDPDKRDKKVADAICSAFENKKIRCWIAPRDVLPGMEYGSEIMKAIGACRILILVFSSYANTSPHVRREVERAVSKVKIIIPFRVEEVLPTDAMEYCLGNTHWLDALTPPLEEHIATLITTVKTFLNIIEPDKDESFRKLYHNSAHKKQQRSPNETLQTFAVPAYFYPGQEWNDLLADAQPVSFAILNPNNGPDSKEDPEYIRVVQSAQKCGIQVLGYIHTQYAERPVNEVLFEVDKFRLFYSIDGIFLDQVATKMTMKNYYQKVVSHIKAHSKNLVVLNFGTYPDEKFAEFGDVLCVFNGAYSDYLKNPTPDWIYDFDPHKLMHIVYSASTVDFMKHAIEISKQRNAGYIYVTDGNPSNPFGNLPSYWLEELREI